MAESTYNAPTSLLTSFSPCCQNQKLKLAKDYPVICYTCKIRLHQRHDIKPLLTVNIVDEHVLNNHTFLCTICQQIINTYMSKRKLCKHIEKCQQSITESVHVPYLCLNCLKTQWSRHGESAFI